MMKTNIQAINDQIQYQICYSLIKESLSSMIENNNRSFYTQESTQFHQSSLLRAETPQILSKYAQMDIVGREKGKKEILYFIQDKRQLKKKSKRSDSRLMMVFGHPGVGKTYIIKAYQQQFGNQIIYVNTPDLISNFSFAQSISKLFSESKKRKNAILVIDSLQSISNIQSKCWKVQEFFLEQLTQELLDEKSSLRIILITQTISKLDSRLKKIINFEQIVSIGFPSEMDRLNILNEAIEQSKVLIDFSKEYLRTIAQKSQGYTCSDTAILIRDAFYSPVRRLMAAKKFKRFQNGKFAIALPDEEGQELSINEVITNIDLIVSKEDLFRALSQTSPSITMEIILKEQISLQKWSQIQQVGQ